ncbi:MAG: HAMP domain-containing histidine kinase [Oscillospiraceae bacterium]|nr:HAMP domain-containing histidine kinase [Oscillospiraceae bacterium]
MKRTILEKYFDQNLDLPVQFYNLMAFLGMISGLATSLLAILLKSGAIIFAFDFAIAALSYFMLRVAEKTKHYRLCTWVLVVLIFMIAFPVLFFSCGGHKSGTSAFFILAMFFAALMLEKKQRIVALSLEFAIYSACCLLSYYRPELLGVLSSDFVYALHSILNFASCGAVLLFGVLLRNRMIDARQWRIKELNLELEAKNEELLRCDQQKSELLNIVSHEINGPLAIISASSGDTLDLCAESLPCIDEIRQNQAIIEKRVRQIDNILMDLTDAAAIENGRLSLSCQSVHMDELLNDICTAQFHKLDTNNNTVAQNLQPSLPCVWADPQRIEQVMINLLANAAKHTNGGTITVSLKKNGDAQIVGVQDTGEGMDENMAQLAFEHYASTKADAWRHGIGLYICRQIVTAHGGEIWLESERGRGTAIFFSLSEGRGT